MKLARATHFRCEESVATTFIMVPDNLDMNEFYKAIDRAVIAYNAAEKAWNEVNKKPEPVPPMWSFESMPSTMTVLEFKALQERRKQEQKVYQDLKNKATRSFAYYLIKEIPGAAYLDDAADIDTVVHWGHQHGRTLVYNDPHDDDLPGSAVWEP